MTCIITKKSGDAFFCGADSRQTRFKKTMNGEVIPEYHSVCKIKTFNNIFYTVSGYTTENIEVGIKEALIARSLASLKNNIGITVPARVNSAVRDRRIFLGEKFSEYHPKNSIFTVILLFGSFNNDLFAECIFFVPDDTGVNWDWSIVKDIDAFGNVYEIQQSKELYDPNLWSKGEVYAINELVSTAQRYQPTKIAPPVDIVKITKHGAEWIQRKQECQ